ncbi:MAG: AAA family ATPase [Leptolyngbyaceae cyanobacterium SM2_5_2]|nr:AAA family ATPase [Leptolyngbyaceae cyanobacterium SM2_5_2]
MAYPLLCHLLMGPPGSGKSTLAQRMQTLWPQSQLVSTACIRQSLYGDEAYQGAWPEIEAVVVAQIQQALAHGQSVIYEATNAKRPWRMGLLQRLSPLGAAWVGWQLTTPLATCHRRNSQRTRVVPAAVIDDCYAGLQQFPPHPAEGFLAIYSLLPDCPPSTLAARLGQLERSLTNRKNRTQHRQVDWHRYSGLLDFDRLLHLIRVLVANPGLGDFHNTEPDVLQRLAGENPGQVVDALDEIGLVMAHQCGSLYADQIALAQDLDWLEVNGFLSPQPQTAALTIPVLQPAENEPLKLGLDSSLQVKQSSCHAYSDWEAFQRLLTTVRFIAQHPFIWDTEQQSSLKSLLGAMQQHGLLQGDRQAALRKDFEQVLKPFGILPNFRLRRGYFIGSGILSERDLLKVASLLQAQAKTIQDPVALGILGTLQERLQRSQHDLANLYPVRAIGNRTIIDADRLPAEALAKTLERLETEIETGQLLELNHFVGVGRFDYHPNGFFPAWPLQWYFTTLVGISATKLPMALTGVYYNLSVLIGCFGADRYGSNGAEPARRKRFIAFSGYTRAVLGFILAIVPMPSSAFSAASKRYRQPRLCCWSFGLQIQFLLSLVKAPSDFR